MSYFYNKFMQVRNSFFNEPAKITENTPDKTVKKTLNKIEIKDTIHPDSDLEKYDSEDIQHISKKTYEELLKSEYNYDADTDEDDSDELYDEMPYIFKNLYSEHVSTYHYINDRLTRNFGTCMDYDSAKYQIHFCIFSINQQCNFKGNVLPFLQFAFEKKTGVFAFPSIEFNCPNKQMSETIDTTRSDENDDVYFKNECIKKILDIFEINAIDESMMEKIYKGFLEFDENNIFVVFDFTHFCISNGEGCLPAEFKTETQSTFFSSTEVEKYEWGIIDEIRKKEIQKTPIENIVLDFFQKYRYMNEIKTNDLTLLPIPSSLYLCKYDNGSYNAISETINTNYEKRSEHPNLGFFYFFSQTGPKRYAVFSENNIVLDRSFEKMKEIDINEYNSILLNKSVFEYVENNQTIWCVKPDSLFCEL
jgi:hypothetical protein